MRKITQFGVLGLLSLTLAFTASAQHAVAPAPPAPAGHSTAAPSRASTGSPHHIVPRNGLTFSRPTNGGHGSATSNGATANTNVVALNGDNLATLDLTGQVPGLGFDYEYLAATSGNLAEKALIDPATQAELALLARFNRGAFSPEYFLWDYPYSEADATVAPAPPDNSEPAPAPQAPTQIVIMQPPPGTGAAAQPRGQVESEPDAQSAKAQQAEATDFLLVLKDGVMVSAVAFTRRGDQLIYVTKEGNRRTMDMASIDADATSKVNAARGTPLRLEL